MNGSIRWDNFERDQVGAQGFGTAAAANNLLNTAKVQADLFSWNVGLVYKPLPISSFYVAYGTSQAPIGSELDLDGRPVQRLDHPARQRPARGALNEVGTKWELFDKRLLATAALFQTDVDHARTNDNVLPTDPTNAFRGKYRIQGVEFSVAGNITKEWRVFGGLVLMDTEVLASSTPSDRRPTACQHSADPVLAAVELSAD